MIKGTVKFYNPGKGFGFITPDGGGNDVFLQAAALTAAQITTLKPGQRVTFEIQPDKKGPKAAQLSVEAPTPYEPEPAAITVYYDPSSDESQDIVEDLSETQTNVRLVDYITTPPTQDELKRLSRLLQDSQSLVRRYHPLFLELQLNDRFLGENEFWTAVVEHPQLINGPVVTDGNTARVCKAEADLDAFFGSGTNGSKKPKAISPRILAMITGQSVEAFAAQENAAQELKEDRPVTKATPLPDKKKAGKKPPEPSTKAKAPSPKASKPKPSAKPTKPAPKTKALARKKKK